MFISDIKHCGNCGDSQGYERWLHWNKGVDDLCAAVLDNSGEGNGTCPSTWSSQPGIYKVSGTAYACLMMQPSLVDYHRCFRGLRAWLNLAISPLGGRPAAAPRP